jgi:adenosylhomocysteine nucleosidase
MKYIADSAMFRTYSNPDTGISLTVSGPGKINAAAATSYTHEYLNALENDVWLNIGTAGHRSLDVGQIVLAHQIIDVASDTTWYPQIIFTTSCPSRTLKTLDKPSCEYEDYLFDMEAAGFFATASRVATCELVQVLKVISDNQIRPAGKPDKAMVSELITSQLNTIDSIIDSLQQLSRELANQNLPPPEYHTCLERWHFTQYERTTLYNLLKRWQVIFPDSPVIEQMDNIPNSRQFIQLLQERLNNASILY